MPKARENSEHSTDMRARYVLLSISAGVAAALLFYFGTGLHPTWRLVWFAPVPVLAMAPSLSRLAAFLLATLSWLAGALNQWTYFRTAVELPLLLIVLSFLGPAISFGFERVARRDRFVFQICKRRSIEKLPAPVNDKLAKAIK